MSGEEIWSQKTGGEVLNGLAIPEDYQEPRCAGATIHFMDELVMMEKMMADMFSDEDGVEQTDEFDMKKGFRTYFETFENGFIIKIRVPFASFKLSKNLSFEF